MNFTKFYVSVGNTYYKTFNEWFSCNPRTVGQFLHSVILSISSLPSAAAKALLTVTAEHHKRSGELAPLQRDYFCCFMAVQTNGELTYGDENAGSKNQRWQRTSVKVDAPGQIHVRNLLHH